jgi:acyl carrier protein
MGADKTIEARIKRMIVQTLELKIDSVEIEDDEMLFGGGVGLDSVATLEIIVGLEDEFGIEVQDEDLRVELFDSVKALADYVRQQKGT